MNNSILKIGIIILAALSPFVYILTYGQYNSISSYEDTLLQPMFIFINAVTSYYLFSIKNWWIPAVLLMLVTSFSVSMFFWTHNIFAVLFFIFCGVSILRSRLKWYFLPYFLSIIPLLFKNILWAEIISILIVCLFHLHRYVKYKNFKNRIKQ
jgi:positive regulator of sigma E activity